MCATRAALPVKLDISSLLLKDSKEFDQYPVINPSSYGNLNLPNFNNRFDILLYLLIHHGLIKVDEPHYSQLIQCYQKVQVTQLSEQEVTLTQEDLSQFETSLKQVSLVDTERQINLPRIQGDADYFTLRLINRLVELKKNLTIAPYDDEKIENLTQSSDPLLKYCAERENMPFTTRIQHAKLLDREQNPKSLYSIISSELITEAMFTESVSSYQSCLTFQKNVETHQDTGAPSPQLSMTPQQAPSSHNPQQPTDTKITNYKQCIGILAITAGILAIAAAITVLTAAIIAATGGSALPFFILPLIELTIPEIIGYSALFAVGTSATFLVGDHLSKPSHNLSKLGTFSTGENIQPSDTDSASHKKPSKQGFNYLAGQTPGSGAG